MTKTVLVVDDEPNLVKLVRAYLEQEGFRVATASNGREALFVARQEKPDLIVLDLMMPEMDGFEFIRLHRKERETPVILLTARVEDSDKVAGFELGADDYVTKPFSPRELAARVRAVLRRAAQAPPPPEILRVGDIFVDRTSHIARAGEQVLDLTPSEFDLLAVLLEAPGRAFTRMELLERVQGIAYEGYERTIDVHVKNLRAKLEPDPRHPRYIETVYGVGYRFAG
jgi:two-component system alkaline phosphatase synthesis response regulator PhoP